ncbi:6-chlorohydroxyquinol-1,2-dioxygenase [Planktomarina temperata]|nr:6-chlorohydroxyquinol-1,2-dioxygenase [Planktomarina temperata]
MKNHTLENITPATLAAFARADDPRSRQVFQSLINHLHAFVKDVDLTPEEWHIATEFLRDTAGYCDSERNEFILLSDIFGMSMLVDLLANRFPDGATPATIIGPFHTDTGEHLPMGARIGRPEDGTACVVSGIVSNLDGDPIEGALLDVWQTDEHGFYDVIDENQPEGNLRGKFTTGPDGSYNFISVKPKRYSVPDDGPGGRILNAFNIGEMRPAHIHCIISAEGYYNCGTHIFVEGDPAIESDPVFGTKDALIAPFVFVDDMAEAKALGVDQGFWRCDFNFVMTKSQ